MLPQDRSSFFYFLIYFLIGGKVLYNAVCSAIQQHKLAITKNWCFWTVVLEKTLESPLDCKEIQPVHSEGDQPWNFFGRNDAKAEAPILWPPYTELTHWKRLWCWEGLGAEGEGDDRGWHHGLDGRELEWTLGVGDGQGGLECCDSWGHKESDTAEQLNWLTDW